ncbi:hypothetical protein EW146_g5748 [Bondarzewia mesenterica]|uniref:Uncharacterized protein n=1 Tax=Bondarzewia mesenterica TaxID=1095465 RepID=A0A4S4LQI4_9AGAM|nr:hypothetical protein EW146_g5748 [Bondarzewia mesenterica]
MIKSGELMKYPLAVIDKLIQVYAPLALKQSKHDSGESLQCFMAMVMHATVSLTGIRFMWMAPAKKTGKAVNVSSHAPMTWRLGLVLQQDFIASKLSISTLLSGMPTSMRNSESHGLDYEDFEGFLKAKRNYLQALHIEPIDEVLIIDYLEALKELAEAQQKYNMAHSAFRNLDAAIIIHGIKRSQIAAICHDFINSWKKLEKIEQHVRTFESKLLLKVMPRSAVAIRADKAAGLENWLDIKQVLDYTCIGEFNLLRETCTDIQNLPWAQPVNRAATILYLNLLHAREEIVRLNVEIHRLRTLIYDEHWEFSKVDAEGEVPTATYDVDAEDLDGFDGGDETAENTFMDFVENATD